MRGGRGPFVRRPRRDVSLQLLSAAYISNDSIQALIILIKIGCHGYTITTLCVRGGAARGAQDRKNAGRSGLDCSLSSGSPLQTRLRPPPCEDGLSCEGGRSPREEGEFGATQGQTSLLSAYTQRPSSFKQETFSPQMKWKLGVESKWNW